MKRSEVLYELMRKKFPGGNQEMQLHFSETLQEDRLEVYIKMFDDYTQN